MPKTKTDQPLIPKLNDRVPNQFQLNTCHSLSPQHNVSLIRNTSYLNSQQSMKKEGSNNINSLTFRASKSHLGVDGMALLALQSLGLEDTTKIGKPT